MPKIREVLLVDDNPADIDLTTDVLGRNSYPSNVHAVLNGLEAIAFLQRRGKYMNSVRPDIVFLDLNLPGKDGRSVLAEAKSDPALQKIPIIIFSTSSAIVDIKNSYKLGANCYVTKPGNLKSFVSTVSGMANFWFSCAMLPGKED
jgi:two-component system, chemotaxis family, response regulator Rcp1